MALLYCSQTKPKILEKHAEKSKQFNVPSLKCIPSFDSAAHSAFPPRKAVARRQRSRRLLVRLSRGNRKPGGANARRLRVNSWLLFPPPPLEKLREVAAQSVAYPSLPTTIKDPAWAADAPRRSLSVGTLGGRVWDVNSLPELKTIPAGASAEGGVAGARAGWRAVAAGGVHEVHVGREAACHHVAPHTPVSQKQESQRATRSGEGRMRGNYS